MGVPIAKGPAVGLWPQAFELLRVLTTTALVLVLLLGPGLGLRGRGRRIDLAFVSLPGMLVLVATACIAWALSRSVDPRAVCAIILIPVLGWLYIRLLRADPDQLLDAEEARVLLIVGFAFGIAVARTLWSLGPPGELLGGTSYRTFEVGDRSDSRTPFALAQLVAHGTSPFSPYVKYYLGGYTLSDRGPLAGLASTPIVLLSGGKPPFGTTPAARWSPFDPNGVEAYRLAMMALASTAFLSVWTLTRRLAGHRAARFALLLAATTPFLVHEVWFTWPKLLAGSFALLAAAMLLDGRPFVAGMFLGLGYLAHPIALLSLPALVLIALVSISSPAGDRLRLRPRMTLALLGPVALYLVTWRVINWSHFTQNGFLQYLTQAAPNHLGGHPPPVTFSNWLNTRGASLANTVLPLRLFFLSAHDPQINSAVQPCFPDCSGGSPAVVHFYFQYWTTVPFGLGIVFFPLLLQSLWRALRRWRWAITATVLVPFLLFTVYWGPTKTGMLREGLHAWVLTLIVVVAIEQCAGGFGWLEHRWLRALLAFRSIEVLLTAVLPALVTTQRLHSHGFGVTDAAALISLVGLSGVLAVLVYREGASPAGPTPIDKPSLRLRSRSAGATA